MTGLSPDALLAALGTTPDKIKATTPTQPTTVPIGSKSAAIDLEGLPHNIVKLLTHSNDRSTLMQSLVHACVSQGFDETRILEIVKGSTPLVDKYGARIAAEVKRSITKAETLIADKVEDLPLSDDTKPSMLARLITLDDLANLPPPEPLIDGVLDRDNTSVMYGRRGHYKSFVALDMALCVASGIDWHGHTTAQGTVVYVVAEGVSGVHQRVQAWMNAHPNARPGDRFRILPEAINLMSPATAGEIADTCKTVGAALVFIDTFARCLVGGDENSSKDVGIAVETLDLVRRRSGAHVSAVHHSGKDSKAGARGSSALEAAADTVLEVFADDGLVTLTTTKQKNRPEGAPLRFRAVVTLDSVVLTSTGGGPGDSDKLTLKDHAALEALDAIAGVEGAPFGAWAEAAEEAGVSRTTVRRLRVKALKMGQIEVGPSGTKANPRYRVVGSTRATPTMAPVTDPEQALFP